jgi:hypothetical protein
VPRFALTDRISRNGRIVWFVAHVSVEDGVLVIELTVPERVLSLHGGTVTVPVRSILKAVAVSDVMTQIRGTRMPGAGLPGRLAIGTWRGDQAGKSFQDFVVAHHPGPGVVLTLRSGTYDRIVLQLPHAKQLVAELGH